MASNEVLLIDGPRLSAFIVLFQVYLVPKMLRLTLFTLFAGVAGGICTSTRFGWQRLSNEGCFLKNPIDPITFDDSRLQQLHVLQKGNPNAVLQKGNPNAAWSDAVQHRARSAGWAT